MYLILCAMKEEVAEIVKKGKTEKQYSFFGNPFYMGKTGTKETVTGITGVGKVMAAMTTQKLIDFFSPEGIIFTGIAGAVNPGLGIGDIVIAKECMQHDIDATSLGFKPGEIPYTGIRILESDPALLEAARGFSSGDGKIIEGRVLTGDEFVTCVEKKGYLYSELGGDAVEMEGAAAAFTAYMNNTPFMLARIISDRADGNAASDFRGFLKKSSAVLAEMVFHMLRNIS